MIISVCDLMRKNNKIIRLLISKLIMFEEKTEWIIFNC